MNDSTGLFAHQRKCPSRVAFFSLWNVFRTFLSLRTKVCRRRCACKGACARRENLAIIHAFESTWSHSKWQVFPSHAQNLPFLCAVHSTVRVACAKYINISAKLRDHHRHRHIHRLLLTDGEPNSRPKVTSQKPNVNWRGFVARGITSCLFLSYTVRCANYANSHWFYVCFISWIATLAFNLWLVTHHIHALRSLADCGFYGFSNPRVSLARSRPSRATTWCARESELSFATVNSARRQTEFKHARSQQTWVFI